MKKNYQGYIEHLPWNIRRVLSLPGTYQNALQTEYFLQKSSIKIHKLGLEMKKNYQGYIESEHSGLFQMFTYKRFIYKSIF